MDSNAYMIAATKPMAMRRWRTCVTANDTFFPFPFILLWQFQVSAASRNANNNYDYFGKIRGLLARKTDRCYITDGFR